MESAFAANDLGRRGWPISPLEGEMPGRAEGGALAPSSPPSVAFGDISPSRGEIVGAPALTILAESPADIPVREALLDRAMGPRWRKKSSHRLRRGRLPAEGLAFVAKDAAGVVVGTVRLWDVVAGSRPISLARGEIGSVAVPALLLGPLAVDPSLKASGVGSALMRHALAEARRLGHRAILLVGDAPYYARFGFSADKTGQLAMPGPYERHRFLALELVSGSLDGAEGVLKPAGRRIAAEKKAA
jgi:predicted N-acetyltransferase YhbS